MEKVSKKRGSVINWVASSIYRVEGGRNTGRIISPE